MSTETIVATLSPDILKPNPYQPRATLDPEDVRKLADSIARVGLLQRPLVRPTDKDDVAELAFGHLRVDAIRLLIQEGKWEGDIPVEMRDMTDSEMAIIALTENRERKDVAPIDEFRAWKKALAIEGLTVQSLADSLGLDRSTVANNLRILGLPAVVLDRVDSGELSPRGAREFLVLQNSDHSHDEMMAEVIKEIGLISLGTAQDWRVANVRRLIRDGVVHRHEQDWRPLANKGQDTDSFGYGGGASREPTFDTEAFIQQFPQNVHHIPLQHGEGSRAWTCNAREWRRWQTKATREQNKGAEQRGEPAPSGKPARAEQVIADDPVVRRMVGVSQETVAKQVADTMEEPKMGQARKLAGEIHEYTAAEEEDRTEAVVKGYQRLGEVVTTALKGKPNDPDAPLEETYIADVHARLKLDEAGIDLDEATGIVDSLVEDFKERVAEQAAQTASPKKLTAQQREALGSRTQVYKATSDIKGWKQQIDSHGWSGHNPPFYFHDIQQCLKTCTIGAVHITGTNSYDQPFIACINQEHYEEKLKKGKEVFIQKHNRRKGQVVSEDKDLVAALVALPMPAASVVARALLSNVSVEQYGPDAQCDWQERQEFDYTPATIQRVLDILGLESQGGNLIPIKRSLASAESLSEETAREVVANLVTYAIRDVDSKDVVAMTTSLRQPAVATESAPVPEAQQEGVQTAAKEGTEPERPKKDRILELNAQGLSTRKIADQVGVRHSYVDKILKQERERNPVAA